MKIGAGAWENKKTDIVSGQMYNMEICADTDNSKFDM